MDMRELKTLLKFQDIDLNEESPGIRRLKKVKRSPCKGIVPQRRSVGDGMEPQEVTVVRKSAVVDLGGGDTLRVLKKASAASAAAASPEASSGSLDSSSSDSFAATATTTTQPTTSSHLTSSVVSVADDFSRKASLKSFPEVKYQYERPTYASCFIKRNSNDFRKLMDVLRRDRTTESEPQVTRSTWQKNVKDEQAAARRIHDKEETTKERSGVESSPPAKPLGNSNPNDTFITEEDIEDDVSDETSEEESEEDVDEVVEREDDDPYEKAKELVKRIKGKIPDSEDEYSDDEDERMEELAVFRYRETRNAFKGGRPRPRSRPRPPPPADSSLTNKHLTIEKTKEAKFAEMAAMRANESLRRARSLFREISPLRRLENDTALTG